MYPLNKEQLAIVSADFQKEDITFSHLGDDLFDHICCEIEYEMEHPRYFQDVYENIKEKYGIGCGKLKEVENKTKLIINKKYLFMKKSMQIFGIISMIMIAFGAVFRIQHYPGASPLLVLGFSILASVFYPSAIYVWYKESIGKGRKFIFISALIGGALFMIGILFKLQHWPGASPILVMASFAFTFLFIPALVISKIKNKDNTKVLLIFILGCVALFVCILGIIFKIQHYTGASPLLIVGSLLLTTVFFPIFTFGKFVNEKSITGSFIFMAIALLFFNIFNLMLAMNVSKSVLFGFSNSGNDCQYTTNSINKFNEQLYEKYSKSDTLLNEVRSKSSQLNDYINNLKLELVNYTDYGVRNSEHYIYKNNNINFDSIMQKDQYNKPMEILIGSKEDCSEGKARELKMKLIEYKNFILRNTYSNNENNMISDLINIDDKYDSYKCMKLPWESYAFMNTVVVADITILSQIQQNIRIIENEMINKILENKK